MRNSFSFYRDLLRRFFSLKSLETETCQVLSAILRAHFFYNTDSLLHIQYNALGDERLLQEVCWYIDGFVVLCKVSCALI